MKGAYEAATKVALRELVEQHGTASKFGLFFSDTQLTDLADELYRFLETSQNLRSKGDQLLGQNHPETPPTEKAKAPKPHGF